MKTGIAKDDFGINLNGKFKPVDPLDAKGEAVNIRKGHKYIVPDNYDFSFPGALFTEDKKG